MATPTMSYSQERVGKELVKVLLEIERLGERKHELELELLAQVVLQCDNVIVNRLGQGEQCRGTRAPDKAWCDACIEQNS